MAKKTKRKRSSDYAARLATRRKDAMGAYFKALGGPKGEDDRIAQMAKDAGVQTSTFKTYLSGKSDMGRQACERLQGKLAAGGKVLADFSNDKFVQQNGIWIFANPKRKVPFLPQNVREERAARVLALLKEIAVALKLASSTDEEVIDSIAKVTELKVNSVLMVANSCSYMAESRLKLLQAALQAKDMNIDLTLLGEDPRNLDDDVSAEDEDGDNENDEPKINEVVGVLAKLATDDVLVITGGGQYEIFNQDSAAVVVIRPGAQMAVHSVPAGCTVDKGTVMNASDGSGVVSIPFTTSQ